MDGGCVGHIHYPVSKATHSPLRLTNDSVAGTEASVDRRGYTIGYVPDNPARDGAFRRVKVMVLVPDRTRLSVRTRDGYEVPDDMRPR